ncbi:MAG: uracil-DNA glycosylase family protein, partial [Gemmatimonadaceae bacterium]
MDARDRLRRYLEQRREVGESELILDGMPVEDLLALIGAKAQPASRKAAGSAANGAPSAPSARPASPEVAAPAAVAEPVAPPPPPSPRFAEGATADWRQTLRAAETTGGTPPVAAPSVPSATAVSPSSLATDAWPAWLTALEFPTGLTVASPALVPPSLASLSLDGVAQQVTACTACALHERARHAVPGEGNPTAEVVCVGEGPGEQEDAQGVPFVGPSGDL